MHVNIAQIYNMDAADGNYYIAMEYVQGETLLSILRRDANWSRQGLPLEAALSITMGLAAGLHYAHSKTAGNGSPLHIVHRDVSPANVMVSREGGVKLLDFGIARADRPLDGRSDPFALHGYSDVDARSAPPRAAIWRSCAS